jgi:hypothetical protein
VCSARMGLFRARRYRPTRRHAARRQALNLELAADAADAVQGVVAGRICDDDRGGPLLLLGEEDINSRARGRTVRRRLAFECGYLHASSGGATACLLSKHIASIRIDQPKSYCMRWPGRMSHFAHGSRNVRSLAQNVRTAAAPRCRTRGRVNILPG